MNDAVLQVLLILAYLAIGLISVTFPIYAISVNFLPQQKWESEKERKKRMDELKSKISQLTAEMKGDKKQVSQLKEQLDKYEAELEGTELRYQYLTARGAVGVPVILLLASLLSAGLGIYEFYLDNGAGVIFFGVLSSITSLLAVFRLYKTISAVEYGALRPERTVEFDVGFGKDGHTTEQVKLGKEAEFFVTALPLDQDTEDLVLNVTFPPELGVKRAVGGDTLFAEYEDYTIMRKHIDYLPKEMGQGFAFVVVPKKTGRYAVKVRVCAKGIYEYRKELIVEVA